VFGPTPFLENPLTPGGGGWCDVKLTDLPRISLLSSPALTFFLNPTGCRDPEAVGFPVNFLDPILIAIGFFFL